jgi:hypothetical protein
MNDGIFISKNTLITIAIVVIVFAILYYGNMHEKFDQLASIANNTRNPMIEPNDQIYLTNPLDKQYDQYDQSGKLEQNTVNDQLIYNYPYLPQNIPNGLGPIGLTGPTPMQMPLPVDRLKDYDYKNMGDMFFSPTKRPPRYVIGGIMENPLFNIYTRGYPDNPTWYGVLIANDEDKLKDPDNKIIKLFGRQVYPNSTEYEYYVILNTGNDQTKIALRKYKRELFDKDEVYIPELKMKYILRMNNTNNFLKYYPEF